MANGKTILIVDDDEFIRGSIANRFQQDGFTVLQAADGLAGLKTAMENHPDIIILDIIMPEMDGFEVLKRLRQDTWGKDAPVVLLTQVQPDDRVLREIMEHKPSFYLIKSDFTINDIAEKIKERLGMFPWDSFKQQ